MRNYFKIALIILLLPLCCKGAAYCVPAYTASLCFGIKQFKLDTFQYDNPMARSCSDTSNVKWPVIRLYSGKTYSLYATDSFDKYVSFPGRYGLWIDYNNDGDFDDPGELLDTSKKEGYSYKGKFYIPLQIPSGNYRLRIRFITGWLSGKKYYIGSTNGACKTQYSGSYQDYLITIKKWYATDIDFIKLNSPAKPYCGDSFTKFTITYRNRGWDTLKNVPVSLTIQPKIGTSIFIKDTIRRIIPYNKEDTFTFNYTWNVYKGGTFYYYIHLDLPNDSDRTNDSFFVKMNMYPGIDPPKVMYDTGCNNGMRKMYALNDPKHYSKRYWYKESAPQKPIAVVEDTAYINVQKGERYFVRFWDAEHYNMEPYDTTLGGAKTVGKVSSATWSIQPIYPNEDVIIDTVAIYPTSSGVVVICIHDSTGKKIIKKASYKFTIKKPLERVEVPFWLYLPKGSGRLFSATNTQLQYAKDGLYCNLGGMKPSINKLFTVYDDAGDNNYFYNWRVSSVGCKSKPIEVFPFYTTNALWQADTTGNAPREFKFTPKDTVNNTTYLWHFGDGDSSTNATPTHQYKKDSSYKVSLKIINKYGCISKYDSTIQVHYTGIIQLIEKNNIVIRPNPATNTIHISGISNNSITEIRDMQGRYIMQMATGKEETDISSLPKGMYIVTVKSTEGIWVGKFVKE